VRFLKIPTAPKTFLNANLQKNFLSCIHLVLVFKVKILKKGKNMLLKFRAMASKISFGFALAVG